MPFKISVNEKHFDCTWICMVTSHLNAFLDFIKFSEFDILVGILVNESPVNNYDRIFSQKRHSPPNDPPFPTSGEFPTG